MAYAIERVQMKGIRFTGRYIDPDGVKRSAGTCSTKRVALRAAHREEQLVLQGRRHDATRGAIAFREYVEKEWLPMNHIEASTRAAYISNLNKQFFPLFSLARSPRSPLPRPGK